MNFHKIIQIRYSNLKKKKKTREQLEIGKIKFEVIPIYMNNTCIYSLFKPKYDSSKPTEYSNTKKNLNIVYVFITSLILYMLYSSVNNTLVALGIFTYVNNDIISIVTPYLFQSVTPSLTPHLSLLLKNLSYLTI
jgi:hypothetical protein